MASTDNLPAFSGYRNQRDRLLRMGIQVFEYRPDPIAQRKAMRRSPTVAPAPPIFSMHAKTLVVDSRSVFIGTFNLDPRSENLNTEVGVIIHDAATAGAVEAAIELDMSEGNSWRAWSDDPDQYAPVAKRAKVRLLQFVPLKPLL
jgi:putative cardiolipin synthase